jgi:Cupin domain
MDEELVVDPIMRQRYRFSRIGDVLRLELWAESGARVPQHFHPTLEERFEVHAGQFTFNVDGALRTAGPGEMLVVAAGVPHSFRNTGEDMAQFVAEIEPALDMQALFEESAALARAGMFLRPGIPKGLRGALAGAEFLDRYRDIYRQTFPPVPLQRLFVPPMARIERRRLQRSGH